MKRQLRLPFISPQHVHSLPIHLLQGIMLQFILTPGSSLSVAGMLHENNTPTSPHMLTVAPRELPDGYHLCWQSYSVSLFRLSLTACLNSFEILNVGTFLGSTVTFSPVRGFLA